MSAEQIVHDALASSSGVTSIVGQSISPLIKSQGVQPPAVTIERLQVQPQNALSGWAGLDYSTVEVRSWATTYVSAVELATACRSALQAAGHLMQNEFDNYDAQIDPGLYCVTQQFQTWE